MLWCADAFLTPLNTGLLQNIDLGNRDCQALILAPTRELASQIVKVVVALGDYLGVTTMVRTSHAGGKAGFVVICRHYRRVCIPRLLRPRFLLFARRLVSVALTSARTWIGCGMACSWSWAPLAACLI